ncbi:Alpha/gamma-adaptin-binding protein p34 [Chaetomium tenue]|uniref:Alpha/gamma-adaptin-binding protein p34 n=1 Tax=Chaetomium tenue TaxID=1854479 RepID=A0ACB7PI22_9PEZI|nr:Alpha/gamma-adaptin-binding protein p34 [Chaetomium globosum]
MGLARVMEALEANDWSGGGMGGEGDGEDGDDDLAGVEAKGQRGGDDDDDFDPEKLDFGFDREDFLGLRKAIWSGAGDGGEGAEGGGGEDGEVGEEDVQQLERMMMKLQAVRDASAGLPEEQRKRMAARAVGEVMKEL